MATTDDSAARIKPNRAALAVVVAAGLAAGMAPLLVYLRAPEFIPACLAYAGIVIAWRLRSYAGNATEPPDAAEWLLAGFNAVGYGASGSMIGLIWYGLAYGLMWLGGWAAQLLGWTPDMDVAGIATGIAVFFAAVFTLALPFVVSDQIPRKLYPPIAGTRSAYFPLTVSPRKPLLAAVLGAAAVAAGAAFLDPQGYSFALLLTFTFVYICGPLLDVTERDRPSGEGNVIKALTRIFVAVGYEVTEKPTTGNPEVDPLITPVDLLAFAGNHGYAVKVRLAGPAGASLEWTVASDIRRAAKALQRVLRGDREEEVRVEAYLLVIGGSISDDLRSFADEEGVRLAHFPRVEVLTHALKPDATASDLRAWAERLLQVLPATAPATSAPSMAAAG